MKIKTIISLLTVATMLQTGTTTQAKFVEQESTITLNANGGYLGSGYLGTKTEIELETEKGKIKLPLPYRTSDYDFIGWYTEDLQHPEVVIWEKQTKSFCRVVQVQSC